jgi:hypothetical protein
MWRHIWTGRLGTLCGRREGLSRLRRDLGCSARTARAGDRSDPPKALESEYDLKEILIAATIQGAIYSLVKTLIDRGGARAFQRWTGEWPGS